MQRDPKSGLIRVAVFHQKYEHMVLETVWIHPLSDDVAKTFMRPPCDRYGSAEHVAGSLSSSLVVKQYGVLAPQYNGGSVLANPHWFTQWHFCGFFLKPSV